MPRLVFLCVANSARSQMAEGLARADAPPGWEVHSAGSEPKSLHPLAVEVMGEIGVDITGQRAKSLADVPLPDADIVITLCAEEACPAGATRGRRLSWPLPDPAGARDDSLSAFRQTRDSIRERLSQFWHDEVGTP